MKIVICDDYVDDLIKVENLLAEYEKSVSGIRFEVEKFSDAATLYQRILQDELADIYILDMLMPGKTGIDLGNLLEKAKKV